MSSAIEVSLQWQDRLLSVRGFRSRGSVSIGGGGADVYVPGLPGSYDLIEMGAVTRLRLAAGMEAEVGSGGEFKRVSSEARELFLLKDQTARLRMPGDKVSLVVRHAPPSPSALAGPVVDVGSDEFVGVVLALAVSMVIGLYVRMAPKPMFTEEERDEAKITRAKFIFDIVEPNDPEPVTAEIVPVANSVQTESKPSPPAAAAIPAVKIPKSARPLKGKPTERTSRGDLLSTFASNGVREALHRNLGAGEELTHLAGQGNGRAGEPKIDSRGGHLKATGSGADGKTFSVSPGTGRSNDTGYSKIGGLGKRGRADIQVNGSDGSFTGGMDREGIRRVIRDHLPEIRNCYERELQAHPDLYGKLVLEWDIGAGGRVSRAAVKTNSLSSGKVADCLISHLKNWNFPEPPANMTGRISYPFIFSAQ